MSPCGTLYLACEPEIHPVGGRQRKETAAALPAAVAADAAAPSPACEEAEMADKDEDEDDEISSSSGGVRASRAACAAKLCCTAAADALRVRGMQDDDDEAPDLQVPPADAVAPAPGAPHADAGASAPVVLPVALPAALPVADAEGQAFRERTMMVPLSIANVATTPDRLQQLLRIADVEGGAPVSLAFVDSDGTVIVTYMYPGLVPPEVLQGAESEEDDDDGALLATVLPDDEPAAAGADAAGADKT